MYIYLNPILCLHFKHKYHIKSINIRQGLSVEQWYGFLPSMERVLFHH